MLTLTKAVLTQSQGLSCSSQCPKSEQGQNLSVAWLPARAKA